MLVHLGEGGAGHWQQSKVSTGARLEQGGGLLFPQGQPCNGRLRAASCVTLGNSLHLSEP